MYYARVSMRTRRACAQPHLYIEILRKTRKYRPRARLGTRTTYLVVLALVRHTQSLSAEYIHFVLHIS